MLHLGCRDVGGHPIEPMRWIVHASLLALSMPGPAAGGETGLAVDPAALLIPADAPELSANAALRERLRSSPHSYYRRVGSRFAAVICQRFAERAASVPTVTLHGDAHLEQYAVTDRGRGLSDFDDSTSGSALIDLARFATSIELAARERGFAGGSAIAAFQSGYARALQDPDAVAPEPALARELRRGFDRDRRAALARSESLMTPLPEGQTPPPAILQRASELLAEAAHRPVSFFHIKKLGSLAIGIGSAGDERYLLRIEAASTADKDDIILELKEVRRLADLPCLRAEVGGTRILVAQATLAYEAFSYVGTLALDSPTGPRHYWFHAWPDNYAELRVSALPSVRALEEIAFDVGVQLGRGHGQHKRSGESKRLREQLKAALPGLDLAALATALADASEEAWRRFCAQGQRAP
jgi:Uncharacterized protein conserved in bacteria (DUF2252)